MGNFFKELKAKFKIDLNDQQKMAVIHNKGPALVLAGPGSGKTTLITARTAYLIMEQGVLPSSILTVTYNKAAQLEMKSRFENVFGGAVKARVHFSTFHSLCYSIIKAYEQRQGKRFKLLESETGESSHNKNKIIKDIYREINGCSLNDDELETILNEIGLVKNKMIKNLEDRSFQTRNFAAVYKAYEDTKRQNLLIDFDDMLTYSYSILHKCPDILNNYKARYRYFQVDEGQDLSPIQFEVLKLLVESDENNLFLVADDDQSIYGFRGAEPRYILELGQIYKNLAQFKLEENYRSSKNIVELSSAFIKSNKSRYDKGHKTHNPLNSDPFLIRVNDEEGQIAYILEKLKKHLKQKDNKSMAVLYRSNLSSIPLVDRLERAGIPFRLKQNRVTFFEHWMVQDIKAFIRLALDPSDMDSFGRIYLKMNRYISKTMFENALNQPGRNVIERIVKSNVLKPFQVTKLQEVLKELKALSKMTPVHALQAIEHDFKYIAGIKDYCDSAGLSFYYLCGLFGILKTLAQPCKTLSSFLSRLDELPSCFNSQSRDVKSVILTTMHSSKGLEYDTVFIINLINSETPGDRAMGLSREKDESLIEEERRLFYVGMTRAKTELYLVSPEKVNAVSEPRSIFVNEVAKLLNKSTEDQIGEGIVINHRKYGKGIIAQVSVDSGRTMVQVDFKGTVRMMDLAICLENGLITLE